MGKVSGNKNVAAEDKSDAFTEKKNAEKDEKKEVEEERKEADKKDIENIDIDKEEVKESKEDEDEEKTDQESKGEKGKKETKIKAMEEETAEKPDKNKEKGSKETDKSDSGAQKKDRKRKRQVEDKKELEPKTPLASTIEALYANANLLKGWLHLLRENSPRKSILKRSVIAGRGTALKDIPNVAYKLSKRKTDDTLKLLHTILFGRRGKAAQFKSNISRFSGFVWHENEEKQKMKVKEKLDNCVKEKLLELCDVLDIPVAKATSRKEDLVPQLMDFLEAPHSTTSELLAEKDQSRKAESASKKAEKKKKLHESKDESEKDDQEEGPAVKVKTKTTPSKLSKASKKNDNNDANPKVYSKMKTTDVFKGKSSTPKKPSSKNNTGKKVLNGKGHNKVDKLRPSDDELRSAICEVLKEVDFNTATFSDIVKILAERYDTDLTPRKSSVKHMIQDELTRLVDEADEEDEEENAEEDEKQPSVQGVEGLKA
ncbi:hypothetical protein RND71_015279 [Anisodus tanguticus]|uniref:DEK-C domain-containing protein n=1 Tax=Anisodus tanguticus TaxID=243964 RepID=A0AAE1S7M8_9SOLA|nr:hypothetical protein RND71_015279 [Anisodus tanguticus]